MLSPFCCDKMVSQLLFTNNHTITLMQTSTVKLGRIWIESISQSMDVSGTGYDVGDGGGGIAGHRFSSACSPSAVLQSTVTSTAIRYHSRSEFRHFIEFSTIYGYLIPSFHLEQGVESKSQPGNLSK
ncbi:hypothetical protein M8C21_005341 [Ambrosia artemisiifolia]|uniref:Uncharacterized protein n=1 Tax=Ambrosia artemisiifolia TaxID=4212 RepID=A0AAD5DCX5_AMBAR|nr:hypothetical protein M8C21_005341 [Ambrosia artemisiifolia]